MLSSRIARAMRETQWAVRCGAAAATRWYPRRRAIRRKTPDEKRLKRNRRRARNSNRRNARPSQTAHEIINDAAARRLAFVAALVWDLDHHRGRMRAALPAIEAVAALCAIGVIACSDGQSSQTTGAGGAIAAGKGGTAGRGGGSGTGERGGSNAGGRGGGSVGAGGKGGAGKGPSETELPAMLRVRQEHGVAALRGEVYVIGGYAMTPTTSVEVYNPTTRTWRAVASLPAALQHPNVAVVRDRLFIAGYFEGQGTGTPRDNAYVYDPERDRWDASSPLPTGTGRAAGCVAIIGDSIYLFGGRRGDTSVAYASVYDVAADSWQKLPDMPVRREHCGAGVIGGKIYIVGGRTDTIRGFEPTSLVFDPASPGYAQRKAILTPRGGLAAAVIGSRLYTFGGEGNAASPAGVFAEVEAYDPVTDAWSSLPPLALPRHGLGSAIIDGLVYLPGGALREGGGATDYVSVYDVE
jgi:N-acetylneuraminic acid mutarotase